MRIKRIVVLLAAFGLAWSIASVRSAAAAAADTGVAGVPARVACGAVITASTTLENDVGPCHQDGLIVRGDGITINLNGHVVTGSHVGCPGPTCNPGPEQAGILLDHVTGVTVEQGAVREFDGGVVVRGGSANTVAGVNAHDNVNRDVLINANVPGPGVPPPVQTACDYGDGIVIQASDGNRVVGSTVERNGPFSGIALISNARNTDGSTGNEIIGNTVSGNDILDQTPNGSGTVCGSSFGAPYGGMGQGRQNEDVGIRLEGPGVADTLVQRNFVTRSGLGGIDIFDYFCNPGGTFHEPANHDNSIVDNVVTDTGAATHNVDSSDDGIAILAEGDADVDCTSYANTIVGNLSSGNWEDGILIGGMRSAPGHPQNTTVNANTVEDNHLDGIGLQAGAVGNTVTANNAYGNAEFDAADYNFGPACGADTWRATRSGSVNQRCVAARGGTGAVRQVLMSGVSGTGSGLRTTWSDSVHVVNPGGFALYSSTDATCSHPTATGTAVVHGNGTNQVTVSLTTLPYPGDAYLAIAAGAVTTGGGVPNAAVGCTPLLFTGTPTTDAVSSVAITGTLAKPIITVTGTGFGSTPPAPNPATPPDGQQGCPTSPTGVPSQEGYLFGTSLYVIDQAPVGFDAGINSITGEFDCVGLLIDSWSDTQIVIGFGDLYAQNIPGNHYEFADTDHVEVTVLGAPGQTIVSGLS